MSTEPRERPVYHSLFEALTHQNVWRKTLEELVPSRKAGWSTRSAGGISLDNQWQISAFSNYPKGHRFNTGGEPSKSLLVLKNYLTREIVNQQEFPGEVKKVLASVDCKAAELFFVDGRRMLFEVIP